MVRAGLRVEGSGGGLSAAAWRPCGRLQTLAGRDGGERTQQETLSDRGGASLRGGWVVWWMGQAPSGRRWQGSQPSQGATELGFPGPVFGKMQSEAAGLAGSGQAPSEGLGGNHLLAQTDARCPAGPESGSGRPARRRSRGDGLGPRRMRSRNRPRHGGDGRPPVPGYVSVAVGDEAVIAVAGEECQLGTGVDLHPRTMRPHRMAASGSPWKGV